MAKTDIKSVFRLLLLYPGDFDLLGFVFDGQFYFDKMLPMWASISCSLFEKFANYYAGHNKKSNEGEMTHYLDDYLFVAEAHSSMCEYAGTISSTLRKNWECL